WDLRTGKELRRFPGAVTYACSPRGDLLATGGKDGLVHLWEPGTGKKVRVLKGHRTHVTALAFSLDGKTLASGGGRRPHRAAQDFTIRLWDLSTGKARARWNQHEASISDLRFSPAERALLSEDSSGLVLLWNVAQGRLQERFPGRRYAAFRAAFSPDGKTLA